MPSFTGNLSRQRWQTRPSSVCSRRTSDGRQRAAQQVEEVLRDHVGSERGQATTLRRFQRLQIAIEVRKVVGFEVLEQAVGHQRPRARAARGDVRAWRRARRRGAGLQDDAVGRLEGDDAEVDLAGARLDARDAVRRRHVAAGVDDRVEQVAARKAARHGGQVGAEPRRAGVAGDAAAGAEQRLAAAGVALVPRHGLQKLRPRGRVFLAVALRRRGQLRMLLLEPGENRIVNALERGRVVAVLLEDERLSGLPGQQGADLRPRILLFRFQRQLPQQSHQRNEPARLLVARQFRQRSPDRPARPAADRIPTRSGTYRGPLPPVCPSGEAAGRRADRNSSHWPRNTGRTSSGGQEAQQFDQRAGPGEIVVLLHGVQEQTGRLLAMFGVEASGQRDVGGADEILVMQQRIGQSRVLVDEFRRPPRRGGRSSSACCAGPDLPACGRGRGRRRRPDWPPCRRDLPRSRE